MLGHGYKVRPLGDAVAGHTGHTVEMHSNVELPHRVKPKIYLSIYLLE